MGSQKILPGVHIPKYCKNLSLKDLRQIDSDVLFAAEDLYHIIKKILNNVICYPSPRGLNALQF